MCANVFFSFFYSLQLTTHQLCDIELNEHLQIHVMKRERTTTVNPLTTCCPIAVMVVVVAVVVATNKNCELSINKHSAVIIWNFVRNSLISAHIIAELIPKTRIRILCLLFTKRPDLLYACFCSVHFSICVCARAFFGVIVVLCISLMALNGTTILYLFGIEHR